MSEVLAIEALWTKLDQEGVLVDVLALNAAHISKQGPLQDTGQAGIMA